MKSSFEQAKSVSARRRYLGINSWIRLTTSISARLACVWMSKENLCCDYFLIRHWKINSNSFESSKKWRRIQIRSKKHFFFFLSFSRVNRWKEKHICNNNILVLWYIDVIDIDRTSKRMCRGVHLLRKGFRWEKRIDIDVCERMITISIGDNYQEFVLEEEDIVCVCVWSLPVRTSQSTVDGPLLEFLASDI